MMKKKPKARVITVATTSQSKKPSGKVAGGSKKTLRPKVVPAVQRDTAARTANTAKAAPRGRVVVKPLDLKSKTASGGKAGKTAVEIPAAKPASRGGKPILGTKINIAGKTVAAGKSTVAKPAVAKTATNGTHSSTPRPATKPTSTATTTASKPVRVEQPKTAPRVEPIIPADKDLSTRGKSGSARDRIVVMVPDPYWLHVYWELSLQSIHRAEAALGQDWHGAKPIIRLFDVTSTDTTSTSEAALRDITVHGGCNHWYIDVPQPPRSYRADIGYLSKRNQFYVLARSNVVTPPKAGATEVIDESWAADIDSPAAADRILAMSTGFEHSGGSNSQLKDLLDEQFRRPIKEGQFGSGASTGKLKKFAFDLNAELIVYGQTDPTATVTLQNEPVKLRPDGSFTMRFSLPDSRQIIPAVATSADGMEEQTIVLAVERNIKRLDPMVHDLFSEI